MVGANVELPVFELDEVMVGSDMKFPEFELSVFVPDEAMGCK
jgi:hypothetical protein